MQFKKLGRSALAGAAIVALGMGVAACQPRVVNTTCGPLGKVIVTIAFDIDTRASVPRTVRVAAKSTTGEAQPVWTTVDIPAGVKGTFKARLAGLLEDVTYKGHVVALWNGTELGATDEFTPSCDVHTFNAA
jgi:hypothetical protein